MMMTIPGVTLRFALLHWLLVFASVANAADTESDARLSRDWAGNRVWIGPEFWANPLQNWHMEDGNVVGLAAANRTLHSLTHQIGDDEGDFEMRVLVRLDGEFAGNAAASRAVGGFRVGIQGPLDDYRYALVHATEWIDMGIRGDGKLTIGKQTSRGFLPVDQWVSLSLNVTAQDGQSKIRLTARPDVGLGLVELESDVPSERLTGNLALLSHAASNPSRDALKKLNHWRFKDWELSGGRVDFDPEHRFGPILWTQYTLSRGGLKLTALMAPVEDQGEEVSLQIERQGQWEQIATAPVDPLSRTATFRVDKWNDGVDTPYRVSYSWRGKDHHWSGTIRRDPKDRSTFAMGAFSCDHGYIFPNSKITENVRIQDPDLVFFAGDQIYEGYGNFGITRTPVETAALDYLRKFWMFGWSWRDVLKDRPSVIIPDDHDVFQGNIWGHGGRRIPGLSAKPSGADWTKGGYAMDPAWINAVQRTQTAHLPDPYDPQPADQGIGVYFTSVEYGGLSFAVLEDRKFKSGPASVFEDLAQVRRRGRVEDFDAPNAELLGNRQEEFLKAWVKNDEADFKVVLSQTIFCRVTTHTGHELRRSRFDFDANGWPQNKRNKALRILSRPNVVMVHGDQHLGALVHHGVDDWEDAPVALMVPGTANGFPRAWWPEKPGENRKPDEPEWTGRYFDPMGNRMTVLAAANPERGSNKIAKETIDPEKLGHLKGSGHGIIRFNRTTGEATFELWRLQFDAANPKPDDQFIGFPKTVVLGNE